MLEVSSLRLRSPPTPPSPGNSGSIKAAAATDPPPHQLIGFVGGDHVHAAAGFPTSPAADGFMDDVDTDSLLLDYIDFSSCDVVVPFFDADGDVLPDLEADPTELLAEFSSSCPHGHQAHQGYDDDDDDDPAAAATVVSPADDACCRPARCLIIGGDNDQAKPPPPPPDLDLDLDPDVSTTEDVVVAVAVAVEDKKATDEEKRWLLDLGAAADHNNKQKDKEGLELEPAGGGSTKATTTSNPQEEDYSAPARAGAGADASKSSSSSASAGQRYHQTHSKKKPPPASNASNNKRKVKVDWTPDLHRRFVQAVEQLGIDKAVPSRILEIMGIQGLTRHNIASHLQKYRSHRKHLMAREAEAASWAHKRQMYAAAAAAGGTAAPPTMVMNHSKQQQSSAAAAAAAGPRPWVVPTIGFPPPPPAPFCRSLHVWGHPPAVSSTAAVEAPTMLLPLPAVWPRRPTWPVDPAAYWHQQYSVRLLTTTTYLCLYIACSCCFFNSYVLYL
ncbi:hypothetical protein BS78_03G002200 [Paspalum vaginatum]|nr:hypothetical protein BS78_03G002200 [Paspalum vaginatum]KAJ1281805.1 hypothetical protein BS78_03G002200 [Paspalum vaginatum]